MNGRPTNWTELARYIENQLGVELPSKAGDPPYRAKQVAAGVLKKTAAKRGVEVDDVTAAVNWMVRNRKYANHYTAPFYFLEHEVDTSKQQGGDDEEPFQRALAVEQAAAADGDAEASRWVLRLSRVRGSALVEALAEWERDRGK